MKVAATESLQIRARHQGDNPLIGALGGEAFGEFSEGAAARSLGLAQDGITLVAVRGHAWCGFVVFEMSAPRVAHLTAIAVPETERGRGVGRALFRAVSRAAKKRGALLVTLCTAEHNLAALDLFTKEGARIVRRLPNYYPRGQTALELQKTR